MGFWSWRLFWDFLSHWFSPPPHLSLENLKAFLEVILRVAFFPLQMETFWLSFLCTKPSLFIFGIQLEEPMTNLWVTHPFTHTAFLPCSQCCSSYTISQAFYINTVVAVGAEFSFFTEIFNLQNVEKSKCRKNMGCGIWKTCFHSCLCTYGSLEESISYKMRVTS